MGSAVPAKPALPPVLNIEAGPFCGFWVTIGLANSNDQQGC
jgi:hypothetical protein